MTVLCWDIGTAYDFFASLKVLRYAADFGLRPSWAAGVRQRIPAPQRELLEKVFSYAPLPLAWISNLPAPKDVKQVLKSAAEMSAEERLATLAVASETSNEVRQVLYGIADRGSWTDHERAFLQANILQKGKSIKSTLLNNLLEVWATRDESGELLLSAFNDYQQLFFAEEEIRIQPILKDSLASGLEMADKMPLEALIETLSKGVHFELASQIKRLTLIPSYWFSPLVFITRPAPETIFMLYGARPELDSVRPGSGAPDLLITYLKSLADSTRLNILQLLTAQPMSPSELARRLRLRPPTVIHHLRALRLAGLVHVIVGESNERRYEARLETLSSITQSLQEFLENKSNDRLKQTP